MSAPAVCVVTPSLHRVGGTERCLAEQVERWRERFDVLVCTMRVGEDVNLDGIKPLRVPRLPGPHLLRFAWWFAANHLWRWRDCGWRDAIVVSPGVNCADADAIGVHIIFTVYWERIRSQVIGDLTRPSRVPRAAHRIAYWALLRALEGRVYGGPMTFWAVSPRDARELAARFGRPPGSVPVVPHGVDINEFAPDRIRSRRAPARCELGVETTRVLLLVANDEYKKGVDLAVACLPHLPEDVLLAAAGHLDASQVQRWAESAGVSDRVVVWPHTPDVRRYYAAADVLIAPSREDAFNLPVLEALACGLPVVVSARAGVTELLDDGAALVLEDPEDPTELASLVRRALDDGESARLRTEGRRAAQRFSWDANADRTADLIEREATTPRVLVLTTDPHEAGGVGRATRTLIHALADLYGSERVGVLPVRGGDASHDLPGWWLHPGVAGSGPVPWYRQALYFLSAVSTARRWRRRLVVVAAHPHLAPVARAASLVARCQYAVWAHGYEVWQRVRGRVRTGLRGASRVWAVSRFTGDQVGQRRLAAADRITVVPHAMPSELASALATPDGASHDDQTASRERLPTVLSVARLTRDNAYKGIDTLLRAWPTVRDKVADARLRIVGDGDDLGRLTDMAQRVGVGDSVQFTGRISDGELAAAYAQAQLFALPARARTGTDAGGEGFGLVFLEAAAAGLPVVAGRAGGAVEALRHGETGLLVDPHDEKSVAGAIIELLTDTSKATAMGEAGRRWVRENFSYERFRDRVDEEIRVMAQLVEPA